jgi:hypothetical protein
MNAYESETCPNGHHPDLVGRVRPQWILCELCQQVEEAQAEGPMGDKKSHPGYFLTLTDQPPDDDD